MVFAIAVIAALLVAGFIVVGTALNRTPGSTRNPSRARNEASGDGGFLALPGAMDDGRRGHHHHGHADDGASDGGHGGDDGGGGDGGGD